MSVKCGELKVLQFRNDSINEELERQQSHEQE